VYQERCQNNGKFPVHVVIGMAGMALSDNLEDELPPWLVTVNAVDFGYTRIDSNATSLHFQFFDNLNELKDEFFIKASS